MEVIRGVWSNYILCDMQDVQKRIRHTSSVKFDLDFKELSWPSRVFVKTFRGCFRDPLFLGNETGQILVFVRSRQ